LSLFLALADLIYPAVCQTCGVRLKFTNTKFLCQDCLDEVSYTQAPCFLSYEKKVYFDKLWSVCIYNGVVKKCIHLFKYKNRLCLLNAFEEMLTNFTKKFVDIEKIDWLAPVPLHRTTFSQRGFNQSRLLAKSLSKAFDKRLCNCLLKARPTVSQSGLTKHQRSANVKGVFKIKKTTNIKDKTILLIDDVFTTGSTINECSKVLRRAGARSVEALTLARGA